MTPPHRGTRLGFESILLVSTLLAFAGCMVGPDYQRPKVSVSPNWLESGDQRVSTESTTYREWWRAFDDPALDRLIARAYRDNLTLQTGRRAGPASPGPAGHRHRRDLPADAAGHRFRPVQPHERPSHQRAPPPTGGSFAYWQSQIGAQASWELDFWGKFRRGIESADASLLSTLADYDNTLVTLTADVANSYIALRTAEERIRIARENVETQEQTLKIVEARFKYGTVTQLDVEQARTSLLNTLAIDPDPGDAAAPGPGCPQRAAGHAAERSERSAGRALRESRSRRARSSWASRPTCCAAGRISGAPSCRRSLNPPRSAWPRPSSSRPSR